LGGGVVKSAVMPYVRDYIIRGVNSRLTSLGAGLYLTGPAGRHRLTIEPGALLPAMWLQFAFTIAGGRNHRQCDICRRFFEVSPEVNRADRRYCGNACRNRALRQRQKIAREMRAASKSLREIVNATGSDMETVKKWLKGEKRK
jgi:hypothetical protein